MSVASTVAHWRTFTSLRNHRNYRLYFGGQVVSVSGTWVQNVAQAWLVLQLTHSPGAVGVLAACQFGPFALFGLLGGVLIDRLDNRRVLMGTQTAMMVLAVLLSVLALTHVVTVWQVDLVAVGNGLVLVLDTPARQAFTIQMVGRSELPNAVALNSSLFNASRIVGPGIGGLIIAGVGVGVCFLVNAVSFLAVLAGLAMMRTSELHPPRRESRPRILRGIADGMGYAWHTPAVLTVLLMMLFIGTISINFNVLLPVLASRTLSSGPEIFGWLSACFGAGALVGALLSASLARASWRVLVGSALGFGASELLLAPQTTFAAAAALLVATGMCFSLYTSNSNSSLQLVVPDHLRGRVMSLYAYVFFGTAPLGGLLAGWLAERGGTRLAFLVAGGTGVVMAAVGAMRQGLLHAPGRTRRPLRRDEARDVLATAPRE